MKVSLLRWKRPLVWMLAACMGSAVAQIPTTAWEAGAGSWHTSDFWSNGVPTSGVAAVIDNNGNVSLNGTAAAYFVSLGQGTLSVSSGTLTTEAIDLAPDNESQIGRSELNIGAGGVVEVIDGGVSLDDIYDTGKPASLSVTAGGVLSTGWLSLDQSTSSEAGRTSALVSGAGSRISTTSVWVGGGSRMTVEAGGKLRMTVGQNDSLGVGGVGSRFVVTGSASSGDIGLADGMGSAKTTVEVGGHGLVEVLAGAKFTTAGTVSVNGNGVGSFGTLRISGSGSRMEINGDGGATDEQYPTGAVNLFAWNAADPSVVVVADGGTLDVNGNGAIVFSSYAESVIRIGDGGKAGVLNAELITAGSYLFDTPNGGTLGVVHFNHTGEATLDARIVRGISVVKDGPGTSRLTADNAYWSETEVNAGTLLIDGDQSGSIGAVTVAGGATLGGVGKIGGAVEIQAGGMLAGALTLNEAVGVAGTVAPEGALAFGEGLAFTGGEIVLDLVAPLEFDKLIGGGALELGDGVVTLNLVSGVGWEGGDSIQVFEGWSSIAGSFVQITGTDLGGELYWDTSELLTDGTLTVVPEPGTWMLLAAGLLLLWGHYQSTISTKKK